MDKKDAKSDSWAVLRVLSRDESNDVIFEAMRCLFKKRAANAYHIPVTPKERPNKDEKKTIQIAFRQLFDFRLNGVRKCQRKFYRKEFLKQLFTICFPKVQDESKKEKKYTHEFKTIRYQDGKEIVRMTPKTSKKQIKAEEKELKEGIISFFVEQRIFPRQVAGIVTNYCTGLPHLFGTYCHGEYRNRTIECMKKVADGRYAHLRTPGFISGNGDVTALALKYFGQYFDISHPVADVEHLGVMSERGPWLSLIDLRHFVIEFDHRVDFYHISEVKQGEAPPMLLRYQTIRPVKEKDEVRAKNDLRSKGYFRYGFQLTDGVLEVWNAYNRTRSPLCRLRMFPLNCPHCK